MAEKPVQIFLSYAWNDNSLPPGDPSAKNGFVAALAGQIEYWFNLANPKPRLWWDRDNIDDAQEFRPAIQQAIDDSSFLLIILSEHWLASEFCQKELQLFRQRWQHEDDFHFKHRIVLAHKTRVPRERHPALFPEQRGLPFFSGDIQFYRRGRGSEEFYALADDLAQILVKRAKHEEPPPPLPPPPPPSGLKVYLAKPAADMREQYLRLHKELLGHGFNVVPPVSEEIPLDATATNFIDRELYDARASIHVLGRSAGPAPVDLEHIVKLQLAKTADKVPTTPAADVAPSEFRRIIWAPKIFEDARGQVFERDPIETFKSFGSQLPGDRIEGDSISPFVEFVLKHLGGLHDPPPPPPPADGHIYLCHDETDTGYAIEVANLLEQNNINYIMPVYYNTSEIERRQFHKDSLSECTVVVMCWAKASEMWARAQSKELRNWQTLGRKQQFVCRGLIAGPPPHERKDDKLLRHLFPPRDIDIVLNWTETGKPTLDVLKRIFSAEINVP
jgi:hypothetical protein